ncbi:Efflux pump membrane transporter BepE [Raoultella terrigena]|uniref:Efflux pump membrane transporter BepE n=1 Tax=Raoultella terrigena TaxID=577 RepID=A0A4U9DFC9_RAOTE|nr:Efflux pump membrane transporter BepE [Raoultella terrigena]
MRAELTRLHARFPPDLTWEVKFDTTRFVSATIKEIGVSLVLTLLAVVAVVSLFLQSWRATLIVALAIPVSLIGTFAVLYLLGYSANTLSLFAAILALTMVVDDAIVVVESVESQMAEGLGRLEATAQALRQIAGPVIATTLVLLAVFVPVALLPGIVGELYRQFAVTLSTAVTLSSVVALTLTPALCALLLRPRPAQPAAVWRLFNRGLDGLRDGYGADRRPHEPPSVAGAGGGRAGRRGGGVQLQQHAEGLSARGRSGLLFRQRPAAGGGFAGAHRGGDVPGARAAAGQPGGGGRHSGVGLQYF